MVGVQAKDEPEPDASSPSQSPAPPVIAVQKSESAVPTVPKILNVPPPIARLVVEAVVEKRKGLVVGVAVVLVVFGVVTIRRNQEWKSEVSLWRAETRNNPKAGRAWMELGLAYEKTGKPEEAVEAYNRVIAKSPDVDAGYLAAAAINQSRGNYGAAVGNYEGLVAVAPNDGSARSFLAYLRQVWAQKLVDQGEGRLAVAQLKKAMEEDIGLQLAGEIGKICRADPGACRE